MSPTPTATPFHPDDYPAFAALLGRIRPGHALSATELRHLDEHLPPGHRLERRLLREGDARTGARVGARVGALIGAVTVQTDGSGERQYRLQLALAPERQQPELRQRLYELALALLADFPPQDKPLALVTTVREDEPEWLELYTREGFAELERAWQSTLDVTRFDPTPFAGADAKARAAGVRFATVAELPDDPALPERLYRTIVELLLDVPHREPLNIWPFETWLERYWRNPQRQPEATFLALAGPTDLAGDTPAAPPEIVGFSELRTGGDPHTLQTGLTGVRRPWRRNGVAMALKLRAIAYARAAGASRIVTHNHSVNRPMLAINEALGFVKEPAEIRLKKVLQPA